MAPPAASGFGETLSSGDASAGIKGMCSGGSTPVARLDVIRSLTRILFLLRKRGAEARRQPRRADPTLNRRHSDFWLLTSDSHIPKGYQGRSLAYDVFGLEGECSPSKAYSFLE